MATNCFTLTSNYTIKQHQVEQHTRNKIISFIVDYLFKFETIDRKFLKKNGACVFWAPVFFVSLLAGKLNTVKPMLTRKQFLRKKKLTKHNLFFTLTVNLWQCFDFTDNL